MTLEALIVWFSTNQDPIPRRMVTMGNLGEDGLPQWTREFETWMCSPGAIVFDEELQKKRIDRYIDYAYPMRRAIDIADQTDPHPALPRYGHVLRSFTLARYDIDATASLFARKFPVMGEPRITRLHLRRALALCERSFSLIPR